MCVCLSVYFSCDYTNCLTKPIEASRLLLAMVECKLSRKSYLQVTCARTHILRLLGCDRICLVHWVITESTTFGGEIQWTTQKVGSSPDLYVFLRVWMIYCEATCPTITGCKNNKYYLFRTIPKNSLTLLK